VTPIIARLAATTRASEQRADDEFSWFESRESPTQRVA
jgi:hypothetical protein